MLSFFQKSRFNILLAFIGYFLIASFIIRSILLIYTELNNALSFVQILKLYTFGAFYDFGTISIILSIYALYLLLVPNKYYNGKWNKILTKSIFFILVLITLFSFFAELTFWQEFQSRFNFIAVDYLIYTFEVINNINESYPLPILITVMFFLAFAVTFIFSRLKIFNKGFSYQTSIKNRITISGLILSIAIFFIFYVKNSWAENSNNRYVNELSKAGIYSFFAAFKNNELNYRDFYKLIEDKKAFDLIRKELTEQNTVYVSNTKSIKRKIKSNNSTYKPNIITITVESLSADFLSFYGNKQHITPHLDTLMNEGIFFSNMYATGTRTVRGMEALTLAIPPTPGSSIVRREDNKHLFTVGHVFKEAGYTNTFFYGGDGYFDNMNNYFGNNGYDIVDRGRKLLNEKFDGQRTIINDSEVTFENAWGICDEDIFNVMIKDADTKYKSKIPFNNFVMTTSNHRPFTFPEGKIDLPVGSREAAVKYTDYAIGKLIEKIKTKPWFANTIVIIVADHCASSAGKNEIDISKYQIPCMILNIKDKTPINIKTMISQIDIYPTLWALMGWSYTNNFYGKNVLDPTYQPRAVLGTYQKLVYLKSDSMVVLSPQRKVDTYLYTKSNNEQKAVKLPNKIIEEGIANYQTAFELYKNGSLKY